MKSIIIRVDNFLFVKHKWIFIKYFMLNQFFYKIIKKLGFIEGEHQIGRLYNMKKIFKQIRDSNFEGEILEFGCHQGFGLLWLAKLRNKFKLNLKIIGIDSFEGLPESSTKWIKGEFNDTSENVCKKNIQNNLRIDDINNHNIYLVKGWFNDEKVIKRVVEICENGVLFHIDCDLGSSSDMALSILEKLPLNERFYILFDDWFIEKDEIPASFDRFCLNNIHRYKNLSRTNYTNYFSN
jgi:hypothetical protein